MNIERYCQSIRAQYISLQQLYVLQDAEDFQPSADVQAMLFADRVMLDWQPKSVEQKGEDNKEQLKAKVESYKVLDGLRQFAPEHVLLIGKPGSGKTTALQKLLLEEVGSNQSLTLLIELRGFQTSILDIAYKFTETHQLNLSLETIKQRLFQGDCLLLIDGLNELPSKAAQADLSAFLKTYKRCRVVATTRDIELGGDFGIEKKLELQPLTPKQVEKFIYAYLSDEAQAAAMQRQLQPRLKDFQETPLLLLMLCAVFKKYNRIPDNLGLAFREFSQLYDESFKQGVEKISYCRDLLSYLAFKMLQGKERLIPLLEVGEEEATRWLSELAPVEDSYGWAQNWLSFLRKYHLLRKRSDNRIEFCHQLWQEYYAAEYLVRYLPAISGEQVKANFLNLLKWTEPLKLVQELSSSQTQALRIAKLGLETDLLLGAVLSGGVPTGFSGCCIDQLKGYPYSIRWKHVGWQFWRVPWARSMLLLLLLKKAVSLPATKDVASTFLKSLDSGVRCRAAEMLRNIGDASTLGALSRVLKDKNMFVRLCAVHVAEKIGDASALSILGEALKDEDSFVVMCATSALKKIGDANALSVLKEVLKDKDSLVRIRAVEILTGVRDANALSILREVLEDEDSLVRFSAAKALMKTGDANALSVLRESLKDKNSYVRRDAVKALECIGDASALSALRESLKDKDRYVRSTAVEALGKIGDASALDILRESLKGKGSYSIRRDAVKALGRIGDASALDILREVLEDRDSDVRRDAVEALENIGDASALSVLKEVLRNEDSYVRYRAAKALVKTGDASALSVLRESLKDKDRYVRRDAVEALGKIGDASALSVLRESLKDQNSWVRRNAAEALGEIGDASALSALRESLKDKDSWVRSTAVEALGKIGDASALSVLRESLKDKDSWVRRNAAAALGKIGDASALSALKEVLGDEDKYVRHNAAAALGKIGDASAIAIIWQIQLQPRCLYSGDDYTSTIEAIQNKCQFYNLALCQKEVLALPAGPVFQIPAVNPLQLQTTISGEIGAVNINSVANGPAIGTQINRSIPPTEN